ncbi:MAG: MFS transporter [Candidatus Lokiarchaeota archaeon]|nr:MFS transporter [Candidatus Lokiarchaeota archaeon]
MNESQPVKYNKILWPIYFLNGFQSILWGGITFLIVPLSRIMWPSDPTHALEMGIIITTLSWSASISGLLFGHFIDKHSRKKILIILSIFRGFSALMLGFGIEGGGYTTWIYFLIFVSIFGVFGGLSWPTVISLTNDIVPKEQRSRFFGVYELIRSLTMTFGFLVGAFLVQTGFWRQFFWGTGAGILIFGLVLALHINEPKRGAQQEELIHVLQEDILYDYKINREMMKKTMLSKTNVVALIEGVFTWILMGSINFLILNLIQNEPHNISEFSTSIFMVCFGLTGGIAGQLGLARLSDRFARKHVKARIYMIIIAIAGGIVSFVLFFFIPWPHLSIEQGKDVGFLMALPVIWLMGSLFFFSRSIFSLYIVNQSPILQQINLPEAQGQIVSWNQFLENLGRGIGPSLSGILLVLTFYDYQLTILILTLCILPGIILWSLALKWLTHDTNQIREILKKRANSLQDTQRPKESKEE